MAGAAMPHEEHVVSAKEHAHWTGLSAANLPGRYTILLVTILILLVSQPLLANHRFAQSILTTTFAMVLLAALYALRTSRGYFVIALILMVPGYGARLALLFVPSVWMEILAAVLSSLFLLVTVAALVTRLFTVRRVTLDTIGAAVCAYLLMGVAWGFIFAAIELSHPRAFSTALLQPAHNGISPLFESMHSFMYYSFVCLTTMGYGDIVPITDPARIFSVMEAVFGQLYIAILISRLVSLEVAQSMLQEREDERTEGNK